MTKATHTELMLSETIGKQLLEASKRKELISIYPYQRGIGKTTGLIDVARQLDAYVLVGSKYMARHLASASGYEKIVGGIDIAYLPSEARVVADEDVNAELLRGKRFEVMTGFKKKQI